MTRFNSKKESTKVENLAGGQSFKQSDKMEFVSILLTSFVKDQFYKSSSDVMKTTSSLIDKIDKKFAAKAAIYARTKFGMRSITHVVAGDIAAKVKGEKWTKVFFEKVIFRPDDITETLAYYMSKYGKPLPNSLKKGLAAALGKLDEYKLAKYKKDGAEISMIDAVNLVHPKATPAITKLMTGELKPAETWETKMTQAGQKAENAEQKEEMKKDVWVSLIKENKLGYFALLRNLRNITQQAPEVIDQACEMLVNKKSIAQSLVLPFRFMTAVKQLQEDGINEPRIYKALSEALEISVINVPAFAGDTLVVVDHSGSMDSVEHGNMTQFELGALFGVALAKKNGSDFLYFGDTAKYAVINPVDSIPTLVEKLKQLNNGWDGRSGTGVGHGTNFHSIFEKANKKYDRIIIFSDMQGWEGYYTPTKEFNAYKSKFGATPFVYSIDLAGHGTLQFPEAQVFALAGFSEKIFDIMGIMEQDKNALIAEIEAIEL